MSLNHFEQERRLDLVSLRNRGVVLKASTRNIRYLRELLNDGKSLPFAVDFSGAIIISDDPHEMLFRLPADEVLLRGNYLPDGKAHVGVNEFPTPEVSKSVDYNIISSYLSVKIRTFLNET